MTITTPPTNLNMCKSNIEEPIQTDIHPKHEMNSITNPSIFPVPETGPVQVLVSLSRVQTS